MQTVSLPSPLSAAAVVTAALLAAPAHADPPVAPAPSATPPAAAPLAPAPTADEDARRLRFTSGVSLTGLGALTLALGSVLGVRAIVSKNDIGAHCTSAGKCDLTGYTYFTEAQDFSIVSTACFILGLAAAGAGAGFLISSAPRKTGASAWVAPIPGGIAAGGHW